MAEAKKPKPKPKAGMSKEWYDEQLKKLKAAGKKKDWIILGSIVVIIIIVVIVAAVVTTRGDDEPGKKDDGGVSSTLAPDTSTSEPEATTTTAEETTTTTESMLTLSDDGTYLVGEDGDIPAGTYKAIPTGGGAYYQISYDANGNDVKARVNLTATQDYLEVEEGQYLELHNVEITLQL